jgi:hypothetical protein
VNSGFLIFAVLFGIAGYGEANRFNKRYGRTPFGWPAIVWGIVCFLSFLIGLILLAIGERIGRKAAAAAPTYGGSYNQPVYGAPGYGAPGYAPPGYAPPGYAPPGYAPPGYAPPPQAPTYGPPPQQPPTYGPPPQQPPTYGPPPQQPPTYGPPAQPPQPFTGDILPNK